MKYKHADLFEDKELQSLKEKERMLKEAEKEIIQLPAKLAREKLDRDSTMPPMAEILMRRDLKKFEENLSRGQIENVLRVQRRSLSLLLLLASTIALLLFWAYQSAFN